LEIAMVAPLPSVTIVTTADTPMTTPSTVRKRPHQVPSHLA